MDKNVECKIVQDLLLGYHDGVLNNDSKKLVETHIKNCEKCKEKLASINEELDKKQVKESQIVNYMKQYRKKGLIKSVIIAICIVLFLAAILFLREYVKVNDFIIKREKTLESNNIYTERRSIGNDAISIFKNYYKDGKQKEIAFLYSDSGEEQPIITYNNGNSHNQKILSNYLSNINNFSEKLMLLREFRIARDEKGGKQYWVLTPRDTRTRKMEIWINCSTGLVEKEIYYNIIETYFNDTNLIKNLEERIEGHIYFYDFDIVTDNDVQKTD